MRRTPRVLPFPHSPTSPRRRLEWVRTHGWVYALALAPLFLSSFDVALWQVALFAAAGFFVLATRLALDHVPRILAPHDDLALVQADRVVAQEERIALAISMSIGLWPFAIAWVVVMVAGSWLFSP